MLTFYLLWKENIEIALHLMQEEGQQSLTF